MAISLNQMRTVIEAGEAVPKILQEALPGIQAAGTKLDEFTAFVTPQRLEKVVEQADGGFAYVTSRSDAVMDMPWADAVAKRSEVRGAIGEVEDVLSRVKGGSLTDGQVAGPPSLAVQNATEALAELDLAQTQLAKTLHVYVGQFGGSHAQLVPKHVEATAVHLGRAERLAQAALRSHVNG
jgi:hypothetical protein